MSSRIACQLYTLRDFCQTPLELAMTLARVRKIGYEAVQVSGLGPIDSKDLGKLLDDEGLECCATHFPVERFRTDLSKLVDDHTMWKCKYTAIGGFFPTGDISAETWTTFGKEFSGISKAAAEKGLRLGYHNHSHELAKFGGKTGMELLMDQFDPSVWMEIDTYWIQHGGGDPVQWIDKVAGRIPCVHLKDMAVTADRKQQMAEVGEGNMNWSGILAACKRAGVEWYIIEQDDCNGRDPFESIAISLRNVKAMGIN